MPAPFTRKMRPQPDQLDIKHLVRPKPVSPWSVSRASSGTVSHVRDNHQYGSPAKADLVTEASNLYLATMA